MSKYRAFLLRLSASLFLVACTSATTAWQSSAIGLTSPPPSEEQVRAAADRLAWHRKMVARPKPTGCFAATFPLMEWKKTQCVRAPKMPHKRPPPLAKLPRPVPPIKVPTNAPVGAVAGNGNDLVAVANGGPLTAAEGSFDQTADIQTVSSVTSAAQNAPGAYALQINVAPFATPACANAQDPKSCQGWLQYLFMNDNNGSLALMEVWLFNFGPTCPGQGSVPQLPNMPAGVSWVNSGTDCVFDSPTTALLAAQPVTSLSQLHMRGEAIPGGQDSVTITLPNGTISGVAISDNILKLSSVWREVEFNVVGYINAQRAAFNSGAAAVVHINVENGTMNAPTIINSGFTGETNNFNLVPPGCANTGNPPSIVFEEITLASQKSLACPPAIPAPPKPPQLTPCQQATEAVTIDETLLAKAQARLSDPTCKGPASVNCVKARQAAQAALSAAIVHRNQVCNP